MQLLAPQQIVPDGQVMVPQVLLHCPPTQIPEGHVVPQVPQFSGSVWVFVHVPLQQVVPFGLPTQPTVVPVQHWVFAMQTPPQHLNPVPQLVALQTH
jgi:hypothetical protein